MFQIAIVLPTYNERENVPLVLERLAYVLHGYAWEAIFVDDNSPDGTAEVVAAHAQVLGNVRVIRRVGRRGLASACIEGMAATEAPFLAVMDADLQHDESILPTMLERLRESDLDVVVGTRNAEGGSMGDFSRGRLLLSRLGRRCSQGVLPCELSDPMSGFFMLRRSFLLEVVGQLTGEGFKILVDLLSSAQRAVRVGEIGYTFQPRQYGETKLTASVGFAYLHMIASKQKRRSGPARFALPALLSGLAVMTHALAQRISDLSGSR